MNIYPYLSFNGTCEEAFTFYQSALGGESLQLFRYGDMPEGATEHPDKNKIMHAALMIGDESIMGSDAPPRYFSQPQGFSVTLLYDDFATAQKFFDGLSDGARIMMPFAATFFSKGFGMLVDRFGTPWQVMVNGDPSQ